jgi:thermitase
VAPQKKKVKAYSRPYYKKPSHGKTFILIFFFAVAIVIIPLIVKLAQEQQELRSNAARTKSYQGASAPTVPNNAPEIAKGNIIVKTKAGQPVTTESLRTKINTRYGGKIKRSIQGLNIEVIEVSPGKEQETIEALTKDPAVEYAEPDYIGYGLEYVPNDPEFDQQYALNDTAPTASINTLEAWATTKGTMPNGQPVKVAILDTGIDPLQKDLAGKIIMEENFVVGDELVDEHGHGTHVAGIVAADTDNDLGVAGTCPDCQLLIGKVLDDHSFYGQYSWFVSGIQWAADNGAKVINMSLGGLHSSRAIEDAVAYANRKGAVVVAAAGNCGVQSSDSRCGTPNLPWYPANTPGVVSVAALDDSGQKATFSNYGTWIDVAAPGASIISTLPNNTYGKYNGTSQATPYTAGTLALIFAKNGDITPQAATNQLFSSADQTPGTGTYWKYGKINAGQAVSSVAPTARPTQKKKNDKKNNKKKGKKNDKKKKR